MASTEKATEGAKAKGSFTSKAAWITGANFFSFIRTTAPSLLYPERLNWIFESKKIACQVPIVGGATPLWLMSSNLESSPLALQNLTVVPWVYPALVLMICSAVSPLIYIVNVLMLGALTETKFNEMAPVLLLIRRFLPTPYWNQTSSMLPLRYSELDYSVK
jgi:hypothetical protein